ncbi:hypothetical protein BaRGS_00011466, partial [Batillaria attramentaria]
MTTTDRNIWERQIVLQCSTALHQEAMALDESLEEDTPWANMDSRGEELAAQTRGCRALIDSYLYDVCFLMVKLASCSSRHSSSSEESTFLRAPLLLVPSAMGQRSRGTRRPHAPARSTWPRPLCNRNSDVSRKRPGCTCNRRSRNTHCAVNIKQL